MEQAQAQAHTQQVHTEILITVSKRPDLIKFSRLVFYLRAELNISAVGSSVSHQDVKMIFWGIV